MTLALDSGTADVVIKSADVALVRSCIQAQTLCVHDFNQVDNESCALQFSVGGKLELWNFWFGTGAYAAQAGGSDNIILGDSAGNPLAETVTVGTQFAVLTEDTLYYILYTLYIVYYILYILYIIYVIYYILYIIYYIRYILYNVCP